MTGFSFFLLPLLFFLLPVEQDLGQTRRNQPFFPLFLPLSFVLYPGDKTLMEKSLSAQWDFLFFLSSPLPSATRARSMRSVLASHHNFRPVFLLSLPLFSSTSLSQLLGFHRRVALGSEHRDEMNIHASFFFILFLLISLPQKGHILFVSCGSHGHTLQEVFPLFPFLGCVGELR